jgi:hypothetical protein
VLCPLGHCLRENDGNCNEYKLLELKSILLPTSKEGSLF